MALLAALLTFLIAGCVVFGLWLTMSGGAQQDVIQQRLEAVRQTERRGNASLEVQLLRDEMLSTVPALNQMMMKWTWAGALRKYINQAGLTTKPATVLLMTGVFGSRRVSFCRIPLSPDRVFHCCGAYGGLRAFRRDCL